MRLLLDTCALIWWLTDDRKLGSRARTLIADSRNVMMVSIASLWEISVKRRVGKMPESGYEIATMLAEQEIELLAISAAHLEALEALPFHHRDPFDHLILAQAKVERARLITNDDAMRHYGVQCVGTG